MTAKTEEKQKRLVLSANDICESCNCNSSGVFLLFYRFSFFKKKLKQLSKAWVLGEHRPLNTKGTDNHTCARDGFSVTKS